MKEMNARVRNQVIDGIKQKFIEEHVKTFSSFGVTCIS